MRLMAGMGAAQCTCTYVLTVMLHCSNVTPHEQHSAGRQRRAPSQEMLKVNLLFPNSSMWDRSALQLHSKSGTTYEGEQAYGFATYRGMMTQAFW